MKKLDILCGVIFLALYGIQGTPIRRNLRCSCIGASQEIINSKAIKDLKIFAPSPTCEKTEIIATVKNGQQTCLNPDSKAVKTLVKNWEMRISQKKKQKKGKKHQKSKKVSKVKKPKQPCQKTT